MQHAAGRLWIDLAAVRENYVLLQDKVGDACRVAAVLKANAYGLGAAPVAKALYAQGCRDFFVAKPAEADALSELGRDARIFILNGFYDSAEDLYVSRGLVPVLGSFVEIDLYRALAERLGRPLPAMLKFNTRMNRLGLGAAEQDRLFADLSRLQGITVLGVMSHLACADEPENPLNVIQCDLFKKITAYFPGVPASLCNSSGIFLGRDYHFDLARPGMALYGLNPVPGQKNPMRTVVRLELPIIRLRQVYKDAIVGYGATYRFEKDSWIATVSAGYADGIFRSLSNRGKLYWREYPCPIRGRVSMDLTTVDLSAVPQAERPRPGDFMELLGPHQGADDLAEDAATIGYEILTSLGDRYERTYTQ